MNTQGIIVWVSGLIAVLFVKQMKPLRYLGLTYIFGIVALILLKGKGYYSLGLYLPLFAVGALYIETYWKSRAWRYGLVSSMILLALPMIPYGIPVLPFPQLEQYAKVTGPYIGNLPLIWEDGKVHSIPQGFADMTGWDEVGNLAVKGYLSLDENTKSIASYLEIITGRQDPYYMPEEILKYRSPSVLTIISNFGHRIVHGLQSCYKWKTIILRMTKNYFTGSTPLLLSITNISGRMVVLFY